MLGFGLIRRVDAIPTGDHGAAVAAAERSGAALVFTMRTIAVGVLAGWLWVTVTEGSQLFYLGVCAVFAVLGAVAFATSRWLVDPLPAACVVILLDIALLTYVAILPGPGAGPEWLPHLNLRFGNFAYFFLYLAGIALTYSPARVVVTALSVTLCWSLGALIVWMQPETVTTAALVPDPEGIVPVLDVVLQPGFLSPTAIATQLVLFCLTAWMLMVAVQRSRWLLVRQIAAESDRANLARFFPPAVAERLARDPGSLDQVQRHRVVVLFMDIVGFTRLSEQMGPEATMALLRAYRTRVVETVFSHGGSLEKFIGDAVKITFGTPTPAQDDARRAVITALALVAGFRDHPLLPGVPISVGIGIHMGEAAIGNIGDGRALEYTVIGDVVNVAARLERLTRELDASILASQAVIAAAGIDNAAGFEPARLISLRNRHDPVEVARLPRPQSTVSD
ncbi:MAG: adenylate/guanylate cyclase domain-containing protein [Alphaproteobacteria bacterium]|nr:adenylate/guanylate cyclase domain-containing protein [Alphaproteobacteria bacterium]